MNFINKLINYLYNKSHHEERLMKLLHTKHILYFSNLITITIYTSLEGNYIMSMYLVFESPLVYSSENGPKEYKFTVHVFNANSKYFSIKKEVLRLLEYGKNNINRICYKQIIN